MLVHCLYVATLGGDYFWMMLLWCLLSCVACEFADWYLGSCSWGLLNLVWFCVRWLVCVGWVCVVGILEIADWSALYDRFLIVVVCFLFWGFIVCFGVCQL